jgi:hypothetical protein
MYDYKSQDYSNYTIFFKINGFVLTHYTIKFIVLKLKNFNCQILATALQLTFNSNFIFLQSQPRGSNDT